MKDIKKTKNLLVQVAKFMNKIDKASEDSKVTIIEAMGLVPSSVSLITAAVQFKAIKEELNDLTSTERTELIQAFSEELDLRNDKAERLIERIITVLTAITENSGEFAEIRA